MRRPRYIVLGALAGALLVLAAGFIGASCRSDKGPAPESDKYVDKALMACLGTIRAYHRQADVHLDRGDRKRAKDTVSQILNLGCTVKTNAEIREAVLDAYGRLASLHMKDGELQEATAVLKQGLHRQGPDSFFRANLHMVEGDLLDAKAQRADETGDKARGDSLRREAIQAFERSAKMNKRLLNRLLR